VVATLHIFFLATAILAHRLKTIITLPTPTLARLRQLLSATQVIRYMEKPDQLNALHPFPIVVYATSLALSVSYQQLRYSRLSSDQEDARQDFQAGCDILQELRRKWGSADAMASLAHRISSALDQLPSLDMLRVSRSDQMEQVGSSTGNRGNGVVADGPVDQHSLDLPPGHGPSDPQRPHPGFETMDLFSDMDDISWMYLDAENPVNFDSFPFMSFDGPYSAW
jgi:hypothetical protein